MAAPVRRSKQQLTEEQFQAIARALADPRRFAIFQQIAREQVVDCCNLEAQTTISPATISHHLKELAEAGLITSERHGRVATLTACRPVWNAYIARLRSL